jgi:hypothetical protein
VRNTPWLSLSEWSDARRLAMIESAKRKHVRALDRRGASLVRRLQVKLGSVTLLPASSSDTTAESGKLWWRTR